jgi:ssDNA-binding Zn-finger/Zn-ribbon topoisomerase 1
LKKHVTSNHKADREVELCPECGRQLSRENLAHHRAIKHGVGEIRYHECTVCPTRFRGKYTLLRHLAKEHGVGEMAHLGMKKLTNVSLIGFCCPYFSRGVLPLGLRTGRL